MIPDLGADRTAEYMEYHWSPEPYLARAYPILNPSLDEAGRAAQQADLAFHRGEWSEAAAASPASSTRIPATRAPGTVSGDATSRSSSRAERPRPS